MTSFPPRTVLGGTCGIIFFMANRKVDFSEGECFHVYNRGNSKQDIFLDDEDRDRFVKLLFLCNSKKSINFRDDIVERGIDAWDFDRDETLISLGAWVLMSNHFHLYTITPPTSPEDGPRGNSEAPLSLFMRKLLTGYSGYFNKKYDRTGSLFEGRFKAAHVADDVHAKYLFSYIHLNPIKTIDSLWKENGVRDIGSCKSFLEKYPWSSYLDYMGVVRKENALLAIADFPEYFSTKDVLEQEVFEWLEYKSFP